MAERLRVYKGTTEVDVADFNIQEDDSFVVNHGDVLIKKEDSINVGSVLDFTLKDGVTVKFSGKVIDKTEQENGLWKCKLITNGWELHNLRVEKTWTSQSPESIVQDIINNETSNLTFIGTSSSGVTIENYKGKGQYAIDIIKDMMDVLQWGLYIDANDNVDFRPKGDIDEGYVFTNGDNFRITAWDERGTEIINHVEIEGGEITARTQETISGTDTEFILSHKPTGVMRITEGGTEVDSTVDDENYSIDADERKVTFTSSRTDPTFDYEFSQPVVVEDQDDESINKYWKVFKKIPAPFIKTFPDARRYARSVLSAWSEPPVTVKGVQPGFNFNVSVGELVKVSDPFRSSRSDRRLVIQRRVITQSDGMKYTLGPLKLELIDWQRGVEERIKKLERRITNQDKRAVARLKKHGMIVTLKVTNINWRYKSPNDSFIVGHVTLGRVRASHDFEADCSDNGRNGTWQGSDIGGNQYTTNGYRLSAGNFNGSDNYVSVSGSVTGVQTIAFALKPDAVGSDVLKLSSSAKVSIDGSGDITTTGLSNPTVYVDNVEDTQVGTGSWKHVIIKCDSVTADDIEIGRDTSYFDGGLDEVQLFTTALGSSDRQDVVDRNFYEGHAQYSNCGLWISMDNPRVGNRFDATYTDIT